MINDNRSVLFTSESVTEGHPDKISDKISDAILDEILRQDPMSRVACETAATTGMVMVMGEITTTAQVDIAAIARDVGFEDAHYFSRLFKQKYGVTPKQYRNRWLKKA